MEEQPAVPATQPTPQQPVLPQPAPYRRSGGNKFLLIVFSFFVVIFAGAAGYLFGYEQGSSSQSNKITPTGMEKSSASKTVQNPEVTQQTKVAKSLDLKPDTDLHWTDITNTASGSGVVDVMADKFDEQYTMIPFTKGKFYTATGSAKVDLTGYFSSELNRQGWTTPNIKDLYLTFKTFRLHALMANTTCGGVVGYVGYKDGMVRLVNIQQEAQTCTANDATSDQQVIYTVFVSDLTPVQYFSDYLTAHAKK